MPETPSKYRIIFDGPPGHISGRFIEVETLMGEGIEKGEWQELPDGLWALVIDEEAELAKLRSRISKLEENIDRLLSEDESKESLKGLQP